MFPLSACLSIITPLWLAVIECARGDIATEEEEGEGLSGESAGIDEGAEGEDGRVE